MIHYWVEPMPGVQAHIIYPMAAHREVLKRALLCYQANPDKDIPTGSFVSTDDKDSVTCQDCKEWMHA